MSVLWIIGGVVVGIIVGAVVVVLLARAAIHGAIGRGLGW